MIRQDYLPSVCPSFNRNEKQFKFQCVVFKKSVPSLCAYRYKLQRQLSLHTKMSPQRHTINDNFWELYTHQHSFERIINAFYLLYITSDEHSRSFKRKISVVRCDSVPKQAISTIFTPSHVQVDGVYPNSIKKQSDHQI